MVATDDRLKKEVSPQRAGRCFRRSATLRGGFMLLAFSIVTIVGSVALVAFIFRKYEHLKDRHKLTAAMATATMGAAMLMVAILPDGLGLSIEGAIVAV